MSGLDFLRLILPTEGYLVGFARKGNQLKQEAFENVELLLAWMVKFDAQGFDVYHACASFSEKRIWNEQTRSFEVRSHKNVLWICALWLDLDTRESKPNAHYKDREEAREAVFQFCRDTRLPPPLFISSGGGLHCYWPLDVFLSLGQWEIYAKGLKAACQKFNLAADPARTADASSVLRTPGMHHHKTGRTVCADELIDLYPIELFDNLKDTVNEPRLSVQRTAGRASPIARAMSAVYGNDPSNPALIAGSCRQIAAFVRSPRACEEPIHSAVVGLCGHCQALDWYKDLVRGLRPDWSDEWADQRWERWRAGGFGPTTCREFEAKNPGGCKGCPKFDETKKGNDRFEITSPILLGRGYTSASAPNNELGATKINGHHFEASPQSEIIMPRGFSNETGSLTFQKEGKEGKDAAIIVSDFPIYLTAVHRGETSHNCTYAFTHKLPHHQWESVTVDAGSLHSNHGMIDIANAGVLVRDSKFFVRFAHDSARDWNTMNQQKTLYEQCGWKGENRKFLVGTKLYTARTIEEAVCNDELTTRGQWLHPVVGGDVREWVLTVDRLWGPDDHAAMFCIMCAFGSVFMPFLSNQEGGTIVSLLNRLTGVGKTMILKICASIWSQNLHALSMTSNDTGVARGLLLAALGNLPVIFDELATLVKEKSPEALEEFVMTFTSGRDRQRGMQHGEGIRHVKAFFSTIVLAASNLSVVDHLDIRKNNEAPGMRVLEIVCELTNKLNFAEGEMLEADLWRNAGTAGPIFIQHVLQPEIWAYAQASLRNTAKALWQATHFGQEARYWIRAMTCALVGGDLACQLGLLHCNPIETVKWVALGLAARLNPARASGQLAYTDADGLKALSTYTAAHIADTAIVKVPWKPGMPKVDPRDHGGRLPYGKLLIRYEDYEGGRMYIPAADFKKYVVQNGYSWAAVVKDLTEGGVLLDTRKMRTLSAGLPLPGAQVACCEFDMTHPMVSGMARLVQESLSNGNRKTAN